MSSQDVIMMRDVTDIHHQHHMSSYIKRYHTGGKLWYIASVSTENNLIQWKYRESKE